MDRDDLIIVAKGAALFIALLGAFFWIGYVGGKWTCTEQWRDSGMAHRYGLISGCMLQQEGGEWIPAKSYRKIP